MTRKEQEEISLIESNVSVDLSKRRVTFKYPFIRDYSRTTAGRRSP